MSSNSTVSVAGLGNAIVDVLCNVEEATLKILKLNKASMQLCDEDFQDKILNHVDEFELSPGGSVANTIATLSALEVSSSFSASIGADSWGESFSNSLEQCKVNFNSNISETLSTGKSIVLITPDGERTMNTHLGASELIVKSHFSDDSIMGADYVFIEGYLLSSDKAWECITTTLLPLIKERNSKIVLTLSDTYCVSSFVERFQELASLSSIIFSNSKELGALWNMEESEIDYGESLSNPYPGILVVTRSERGATIYTPSTVSTYGSSPVQNAVDLTGAGDQFAAGYLYGHLNDWDVSMCAKFGNELGSKIITRIGPRFSVSEIDAILTAFVNQHDLPKNQANVR